MLFLVLGIASIVLAVMSLVIMFSVRDYETIAFSVSTGLFGAIFLVAANILN